MYYFWLQLEGSNETIVTTSISFNICILLLVLCVVLGMCFYRGPQIFKDLLFGATF
jgi:hypothetical protein